MSINIAIDGPSGAGKSTMAKAAAKELGFIYVDTGALYRTIGLFALRSGAAPAEEAAVTPLLEGLSVELKYSGGEQRVLLNGEDVSETIRTPEASMAASQVSAHGPVRAFLFDLQRRIAAENDCVMDGRDIGTVVLPQAQIKIFLTATDEDRARRRYEELLEKDPTVRFEDVLADLRERDHNDSTRALAPLKPAEDSIRVDTTGFPLVKSIKTITSIIREELKHAGI